MGGFQHWREQATWYIDPVSGDDTFDGTAASPGGGKVGPIKTHAELERRWGPKPVLPQSTTINILDDLPSSDPVRIEARLIGNNSLHYIGTRTTVDSGSITGITNLVTDTSYTEINDTGGIDFTGYEQLRFRRNSDGALTWIWRIDTTEDAWASVVGTGTVSGNPIADGASFSAVNLSTTEAYTLETLSEIYLEKCDVENTSPGGTVENPRRAVSFSDMRVLGHCAPLKNAIFLGCEINSVRAVGVEAEFVLSGVFGFFFDSGTVIFSGCSIQDPGGLDVGLGAKNGTIYLNNETMVSETALIDDIYLNPNGGTTNSTIQILSGNASIQTKDVNPSTFLGPNVSVMSVGLLWGDAGEIINYGKFGYATGMEPTAISSMNIGGVNRTISGGIPFLNGNNGATIYELV
jgi:hypothetical protein